MKKLITILAALALMALFASAASASCSPNKDMGTFDDITYATNAIGGANADVSQSAGGFWQPASRAQANEGSLALGDWFKAYGTTWYFRQDLGAAEVLGCPAGDMAVVITQDAGDGTAEFIGGYAIENSESAPGDPGQANVNFWFAAIDFAPIPRPAIIGSSFDDVANAITVDLTFSNLDAGFGSYDATDALSSGVFTHFNLYATTSATDPGRAASAYGAPIAVVAYDGSTSAASVVVDCSSGLRTWLAVGLRATNEYDTVHVSALSNSIGCDGPLLADPDDKFDIIRERGQGQKKGKPFRDN